MLDSLDLILSSRGQIEIQLLTRGLYMLFFGKEILNVSKCCFVLSFRCEKYV